MLCHSVSYHLGMLFIGKCYHCKDIGKSPGKLPLLSPNISSKSCTVFGKELTGSAVSSGIPLSLLTVFTSWLSGLSGMRRNELPDVFRIDGSSSSLSSSVAESTGAMLIASVVRSSDIDGS